MRDASALDCHLLINLAQQSIPQPLAVAVYRITQEALTNVLKHAHATRVEIRLIVDLAQSTLSLSVADDGIGLAPEPTDASDAAVKPLAVHPGSGLGMVGIRERVLAQQGVLTLSANEPHGFKLRACFPIALSQST
jgi:signal transduction histidine kinase